MINYPVEAPAVKILKINGGNDLLFKIKIKNNKKLSQTLL